MTLTDARSWAGPSEDPNDEQFGDIVSPTTVEEAGAYEAVLVGEPYDGAVIGRPGAAAGPSAIREALEGIKSHHYRYGPVHGIGDVGDIVLTDEPPEDAQTTVRTVAAEIYGSDGMPVFLGGDNSLTYPNVAPLLESGSVAVLSFDAHLDCREIRDQPTSGSPYRQLHDAGLDRLVVLGARDFETSTQYHEYLRDRGGAIRTAPTLRHDPAGVVSSVLEDIRAETVYVSVDMDVLDAMAAPGVSAPTPGGIHTVDLFEAVSRATRDERVVGVEVVECAPPLDRGNRTVAAATRTVAHLLGGLCE
jgi:formiminoglutamase